jgi:hypothetical protein
MQIQKRSLNWLPRPSLYNEQSYKRAKQAASHKAFLSSQDSLANSISGIMSNNTTESGNLVAKIAAARLGIKTKA